MTKESANNILLAVLGLGGGALLGLGPETWQLWAGGSMLLIAVVGLAYNNWPGKFDRKAIALSWLDLSDRIMLDLREYFEGAPRLTRGMPGDEFARRLHDFSEESSRHLERTLGRMRERYHSPLAKASVQMERLGISPPHEGLHFTNTFSFQDWADALAREAHKMLGD